ncbi:MAG: hypothetical protein H6835_19215 [Planctomycetes bacterium]|nr:hypothetical protein [Planctomycetota bacterium]
MNARRLYEGIVDLPLRRPVAVVLAVLVVTALSAFWWRDVRFEPDVSRLLPASHPHVRIAELLDDRARPARALWLLLHGDALEDRIAPLSAALHASSRVAAVVTTRRELFADAAARFADAPLWAADQAQLAAVASAVTDDGLAAAATERLADLTDDPVLGRELLERDPLGLRFVLSADALWQRLGFAVDTDLLLLADRHTALVQLRGTADAFDADFATALLDDVEAALRDAGLADAQLFGGYTVARADQERIRADFERASLWSLIGIAVYLCVSMRGVRLPMLMQLPATLSIAWAIPFGCLWFGPLPTVAVAAVAVLCGLGVDFAIHYAARYRELRLSLPHVEAVRATQRATVPELCIDMATTAVTFLAIGAGTEGGLSAFGLLLALGLVGSLLFTVFALPVLLRFAGDRRDPERSAVAACADRWGGRPAARRVAWAAIAAGALVGLLVAVVGVPLSASAESLRPAGDPVAAERAAIEAQLGFSTVPAVALWPAERDASPLWAALVGLRDAGVLRFWNGLDAGDVARGRERVEVVQRAAAGLTERAVAAFDAVSLRGEALRPQLARLERQLLAPPPPPQGAVLDVDGRRLLAVTLWPSGRLDEAAFAGLAARLEAAASGAELHGGPTVTAALGAMLRSDLTRACVLAAALAVLMVTLWQRSLRYGLLSLVPSLLGLSATLSWLLVTGTPLSMISFVAVPFVLGIGVDEGVHLVGHFRHDPTAAGTGATGVGVVRTSLGTVLGFGALLLAESPGLRLLGGLVAFGSAACMLACLFVLAPLLRRRSGEKA